MELAPRQRLLLADRRIVEAGHDELDILEEELQLTFLNASLESCTNMPKHPLGRAPPLLVY